MTRHYSGPVHIENYKKVASTVFAMNDLVYLDANGYLTPAVDGAAIKPIGIILKAIAATDDDYASTTSVPVLVPDSETTEFIFDVSTGTAAQTDVGEWIDIDDANSVDVAASTYDIVFVTKVISTTQVVGRLAVKSGAAA